MTNYYVIIRNNKIVATTLEFNYAESYLRERYTQLGHDKAQEYKPLVFTEVNIPDELLKYFDDDATPTTDLVYDDSCYSPYTISTEDSEILADYLDNIMLSNVISSYENILEKAKYLKFNKREQEMFDKFKHAMRNVVKKIESDEPYYDYDGEFLNTYEVFLYLLSSGLIN